MAVSLSQSPLSLILLPSKPLPLAPLLASTASSYTSTTARSSKSREPIKSRGRRLSASLGNYWLSEAIIPDEIPQEIVSTTDDGVSTVISALLLVAFLGLSVLTIGVIYLVVTDFLQKREGEKIEKEAAAAAAKKKKNGRKEKTAARARAGPRGFGQKIVEADGVDDDVIAAE